MFKYDPISLLAVVDLVDERENMESATRRTLRDWTVRDDEVVESNVV